MNLNDYFNTQPRGAVGRLAKAINAATSDVSNWANQNRPVPSHRCFAIEKATDGKVTRRDLRPDDWQEIWPELANSKHP